MEQITKLFRWVKVAKKAALATLKTFLPTIKFFRQSQTQFKKGFTLLEVIIVITIIAAMATLVVPKISGKSTEVRGLIRKLGVLSRELKNRAKLNNATYRLVINMGEKDRKPYHTFWVEAAPGQVLNNYDPKNPPQWTEDEAEKKEMEKNQPKSPFQPDGKVMKRPDVLPTGMIFEKVELSSLQDPVTSGIVYIHYLPSGFADEAAIQITYDKKLKWTIAVQPLTGRVDIMDSHVTLKELQGQ
jgi:prepilin-type N-terminal cleavage/methylation domain-containing protein